MGYAFVAFEECIQLCCALLSLVEPGMAAAAAAAGAGASEAAAGRWNVVAAAAACLTGSLARAQLCVSGRVRGPALRQAEDVLQRALNTSLASQLCCCLAEAEAAAVPAPGMRADSSRGNTAAAAAAASDALLGALAALVHVQPGRVNGACVADHFPLAQMLAAKLADAPDQGVDTDGDLLEVGPQFCDACFTCTKVEATCLEECVPPTEFCMHKTTGHMACAPYVYVWRNCLY